MLAKRSRPLCKLVPDFECQVSGFGTSLSAGAEQHSAALGGAGADESSAADVPVPVAGEGFGVLLAGGEDVGDGMVRGRVVLGPAEEDPDVAQGAVRKAVFVAQDQVPLVAYRREDLAVR